MYKYLKGTNENNIKPKQIIGIDTFLSRGSVLKRDYVFCQKMSKDMVMSFVAMLLLAEEMS
jgi:hypothetical protein